MKTLLPEYNFAEAGSYGDRKGLKPTLCVIHYTAGGDGRRTADWATEQIGRSWHFIICRDGHTIQQVPLDKAAWHAGTSSWFYSGDVVGSVNRYSIGIELANHGLLVQSEGGSEYIHQYEVGGKRFPYKGPPPVYAEMEYETGERVKGWWEPYTAAQLGALKLLLERLGDEGWPNQIIGHDECAWPMGRKMDPGPLFPWDRFSLYVYRRTRVLAASRSPTTLVAGEGVRAGA